MILGRSVLGVIPARGGSKGVPRKNIRDVAGRPLLAWTIKAARESTYIDRLIVSSDDPEIIAVARECGCDAPFVRPARLALDETPGVETVLHALDKLPGFDLVVLLQPTSPLRETADIDACIHACVSSQAPCCIAMTAVAESPYWMYKLDPDGRMHPLLERTAARRQDLPKVYVINGALYVAYTSWLKETRTFLSDATISHIMPQARSLDIDTEDDLVLAEHLLSRRRS